MTARGVRAPRPRVLHNDSISARSQVALGRSLPPHPERSTWITLTCHTRFFWGGRTIFFTTHTHTDQQQQNNSSVLIHQAAGKVTSAGGRVGIRERHSPRAAPTTIGVRRSSELGRGALRRRHWCSKKLGAALGRPRSRETRGRGVARGAALSQGCCARAWCVFGRDQRPFFFSLGRRALN